MKTHQKSGLGLICLTMLIAIAMITIAGCVGSVQEPQSKVTSASNVQTEHPTATTAVTTAVTTGSANVPATKTAPASTSDPSERAIPNGILIDGIRDITAGDPLVVSGRTSLPAGTKLIVKVVPVTMNKGTIAGDFRNPEKSAVTKVTAGSANGNRFSITLETGNLPLAEHFVFVSDMDDEAAGSTSEPTGVTGSALFNVIGR